MKAQKTKTVQSFIIVLELSAEEVDEIKNSQHHIGDEAGLIYNLVNHILVEAEK